MTKITKQSEKTNKSFVELISRVMPRQNGTQAGVNALAESLKRGDALLSQSTNVKEVTHA